MAARSCCHVPRPHNPPRYWTTCPSIRADASAAEAELTPRISRSLLAAWSFDEASGSVCRDATGHGNDAFVDPRTAPAVRRVPGLFGNALSFSQNHAVRLRGNLNLEEVEKLSFTARGCAHHVRPLQRDLSQGGRRGARTVLVSERRCGPSLGLTWADTPNAVRRQSASFP